MIHGWRKGGCLYAMHLLQILMDEPFRILQILGLISNWNTGSVKLDLVDDKLLNLCGVIPFSLLILFWVCNVLIANCC